MSFAQSDAEVDVAAVDFRRSPCTRKTGDIKSFPQCASVTLLAKFTTKLLDNIGSTIGVKDWTCDTSPMTGRSVLCVSLLACDVGF